MSREFFSLSLNFANPVSVPWNPKLTRHYRDTARLVKWPLCSWLGCDRTNMNDIDSWHFSKDIKAAEVEIDMEEQQGSSDFYLSLWPSLRQAPRAQPNLLCATLRPRHRTLSAMITSDFLIQTHLAHKSRFKENKEMNWQDGSAGKWPPLTPRTWVGGKSHITPGSTW